MQIKLKKLMACALVVVLGLSSNVYPILAEGVTDETEISDVSESAASAGFVEDGDGIEDTVTTEQDRDTIESNETEDPAETVMGSAFGAEASLLNSTSQTTTISTSTGEIVVSSSNDDDWSWEWVGGMPVITVMRSRYVRFTTTGQGQSFRIIAEASATLSFENCIIELTGSDPFIEAQNRSVYLNFVGANAIKADVLTKGYDEPDWVPMMGSGMVFFDSRWPDTAWEPRMEIHVNHRQLLVAHNGLNLPRWDNRYPLVDITLYSTIVNHFDPSTLLVHKQTLPGGGWAWEFSMNEAEWVEHGLFDNLEPNQDYTIYTRLLLRGVEVTRLDPMVVRTTPKTAYSVPIPATMTVGETYTLSRPTDHNEFNIPNGRVNVKIKQGDDVDNEGNVTLRQVEGSDSVLTRLHVGGEPLSSVNSNIATFDMSSKDPVYISFPEPTETEAVSAGSYTGTVTFEISYVPDEP